MSEKQADLDPRRLQTAEPSDERPRYHIPSRTADRHKSRAADPHTPGISSLIPPVPRHPRPAGVEGNGHGPARRRETRRHSGARRWSPQTDDADGWSDWRGLVGWPLSIALVGFLAAAALAEGGLPWPLAGLLVATVVAALVGRTRWQPAVKRYLGLLGDPADVHTPDTESFQTDPFQTDPDGIDTQNPAADNNGSGKVQPAPAPNGDGDLITYPFPLRSGTLVYLQLPMRLPRSEATRLGAFLEAIAIDPPKDADSINGRRPLDVLEAKLKQLG